MLRSRLDKTFLRTISSRGKPSLSPEAAAGSIWGSRAPSRTSAPMATLAHAYQAHVGPAKAGVEMLMKNLALEWGPYGIRSNSIIPGFIEDTEGMRRISSEADNGNFIQNIPLRRMGVTQEIGQAAAFLSSPLAAYITGTSLWVDGGQALSGSGFFNSSSAAFLASNARE